MTTGVNTSHRAPTLAPPVDWSYLDSSAHSVQFYADDAVLLDGLSRYIGSALGAGDAGVVIATEAHRRELAERLNARGLDLALAVSQGRYVTLDGAEALSMIMLDGCPDPERFADVIGETLAGAVAAIDCEQSRVAVFGEMVALLWAEENPDAALQIEQLWNDLIRTYPFYLRCAYPINLFNRTGDGEGLWKVCAEHSQVIPTESYTSLISEDERLRAITVLQHKARALETEVEERKKAEEALRESNNKLRQAIIAREEFLSVAAHELKTPLTSLRAFAQLLLRDAGRKREIPPGRLESALEAIELQTGKLGGLVTRLLDTAQIQAGKLRIEPAPTDLVALVQSVLAQHASHADRTVVFDGPEHLDAMVDPVRFEQVITNLVDNAVKFSLEGGVVTVGLRQDDGGGIELSVTDHGVGIPPEQREEIFERFRQVHGQSHLSGMGLGLYITREIVGLHGGCVRIEEPEHGGARFVVALPGPATDGRATAQV